MSPTIPSSHRFEAVEHALRAQVADGPLPHVQFLAARDGEVVHSFHTGMAREDGTPLRADALYRIASMTKAVTAVLFLMLVEEGKVALDDPVASVLPELADLRVHAGHTVPPFETRAALRQPLMIDLLRHTAGFTYGLQTHSPVDQYYWRAGIHNYKAVLRRDRLLADLADLPLVDDPGSHFTYSIATDLIGIVAERLTDRSLGELFAARIFAPLAMVDTGFHAPPEKIDRLTDSWAMHPRLGRRLYDAAEGGLWSHPPAFESGGGGLVSSMADYHRFCRMLLNEGALEGERLLKAETVRAMMRNHLPGDASLSTLSRSLFKGERFADVGHGLGVAVTLPGGDGAPPAGEFHWSGLFGTFWSVVPSERLILILMTQLIQETEDSLAPTVHQLLFR